MSGGAFYYKQWAIQDIAEEISEELSRQENGKTSYSLETTQALKQAVKFLRIAFVYAQTADYLLSGDIGEETFNKRLQEQLLEIWKEHEPRN